VQDRKQCQSETSDMTQEFREFDFIPLPVAGRQKGLLSRVLRLVAYHSTATHLTPPPRVLWIEIQLVEASISEFLWQCGKFWGVEFHINSSTVEIMRVPSSSPVATTFPLPIYHTTTTMSREAIRPPGKMTMRGAQLIGSQSIFLSESQDSEYPCICCGKNWLFEIGH